MDPDWPLRTLVTSSRFVTSRASRWSLAASSWVTSPTLPRIFATSPSRPLKTSRTARATVLMSSGLVDWISGRRLLNTTERSSAGRVFSTGIVSAVFERFGGRRIRLAEVDDALAEQVAELDLGDDVLGELDVLVISIVTIASPPATSKDATLPTSTPAIFTGSPFRMPVASVKTAFTW